MPVDPSTPMHEHPQYLHGQLLGLRALLLTVAGLTISPDDFVSHGQRSLEHLRTAMLPEPISDVQLQALDDLERWLLAVAQP